jgi:transglutaminase-like putative cysteine protease
MRLRKFIRSSCSLLLMMAPLVTRAQNDFTVSKINPALVSGADAILRLDETFFDVKSKAEAVKTRRYVVTILNDRGEEKYNEAYVFYDKLNKINDISGAIYSAEGKVLKKLKNGDLRDFGGSVAGGEITDNRVKAVDFGKKSFPFPYTIEFSYQIKVRNMMFYPQWMPTADSHIAVEKSVFRITAPAGFKFRYKEYNNAPVVATTTGAENTEIYTWAIENVPASKPDAYSPSAEDSKPLVIAAPFEFEVEGYQGNFSSWEDFSKFYVTLNANRDVLPPAIVSEIKALVKDTRSDQEKITKIYKWVQGRSRYVSIQLGIGGWQTIDAMTVANKGYGDCKALTNFTLASLRQAGITCYPALIKAGEDEQIKPDFPSNQFNHVIACAIVGKDTTWLECTSQTKQPNFMGGFTGGRPALLVMPQAGRLVMTPGYGPDINIRNTSTNVILQPNGDGHVDSRSHYSGLQQETRNSVLRNYTQDEQKKWLLNNINLPSMELNTFELAEINEHEKPGMIQKIQMNVRNCATKTGSRLFVKTSLLSRPFDVPATEERSTDFYLPPSDYSFTDVDSVSYQVPVGYKPETTLPASQFTSAFGSFESKTTFENERLVAYRKVVLRGGRYKATEYAAFVDFIKKVKRADRAQVVFVENKP